MAQPFLDRLEHLVLAVSGDHSGLACRHFFNGAALYSEKRICASLSPRGLAFKLPNQRCEQLIAAGRASPLRYFDTSPVKQGYILLPDYQCFSETELCCYFNECVAHASSARN